MPLADYVMIHFFRLIRPINLFIIAATMYSIRFFYFILGNIEMKHSILEKFEFFLLVFSTVMIAAGGNIINDYFDVKSDRINRPERLIITKHVKRREAILSHWLLNLAAFLISIYLSYRYSTFWYLFIHLFTINILWFYSMYFKRKPFIGNLMIAILTALVPILSGLYFHLHTNFPKSGIDSFFFPEVSNVLESVQLWKRLFLENGNFVFILAYFALILNLSREIVKDIEDVTGDKSLKARTLPIVVGIKKSAFLAGFILLLAPTFFLIFFLMQVNKDYGTHLITLLPLVISSILTFISFFLLLTKYNRITKIRLAHDIIKISMLSGILMPFYWWMIR